ncbi:MAG: CAP domain-containing protein [bacterium]
MAILAVVIFGFNFLSFNYLPNFVNKVEAGSINADDLINLANESRSDAGLVKLNKNSELTAAAKAKSEDMFAKGYWAHFGPNGETPWQFIKAAGYIYVYAGENLAKGFSTSSAVHDAWLNSPTHRANIMKPEFRDIGIYVADGNLGGEQTTLVVQMFGAKTNTANENTNTNTTTTTKTSSSTSSKANTTSSKKSSSTSSITTDITPPEKPTVTSPINNGYTNESNITVEGSAESNSKVNIYLNDTKNTEGTANNSKFSIPISGELQKGDNMIQAESIDGAGNISLKSDPVKIIYDITVPVIDTTSFKVVDKKDNIYSLQFSVDEPTPIKTITATIDTDKLNISTLDAPNYIVQGVNIDELKLVKGMNIHVEDVAGNKSDILLDGASLNTEMEQYSGSTISGTFNGFNQIIESVSNLSLRQKINMGIALIILMLLIVDFVIFFRVKRLHPERGKAAFHLPHLALVIAILIFSGIGSIT